jgi:hypothetical protein
VLLAGCGNSRTPVPSLSGAAQPHGFHRLVYPAAGVTIRVPRNWSSASERAPLVATVGSGAAIVALWRFPRREPPPAGAAALAGAGVKLLDAARARDASLQVIGSKAMRIDHAPAIELDARERVGGQLRRVRSLHLFVAGAELVLEQYAPPGIFRDIDHAVFSPVRRSLRLLAPPGA